MINRFAVFVTIVVIVAGALYFPQILQALHGMSILEMMQQAIGFVLHVIVVSILAYGLYLGNELLLPWIKTMREKQRQLRRSIRGRRSSAHPVKQTTPRVTRGKDAAVMWLINQLARDHQEQQKRTQRSNPPSDRIHLG